MTKEFDKFYNTILQEYFETEPKFQQVVANAISGKKVKIENFALCFHIIAKRADAPDILKKLKSDEIISLYRYPVEDPTDILVFKNINNWKELAKKDPRVLVGFVKYGI